MTSRTPLVLAPAAITRPIGGETEGVLVAGRHLHDVLPGVDVELPGAVVACSQDAAGGLEAEAVPVTAGNRPHLLPLIDGDLALCGAAGGDHVTVCGDTEGEAPPGSDGADVRLVADVALAVGVPSCGEHSAISSQAEGV